MCSTHQHHGVPSGEHARDPSALTFRVDDMTCGHCAGTIRKAIESTLPGTEVDADPQSRLVSVKGAADLAKLHEIVSAAGYTPSAAAAHV